MIISPAVLHLFHSDDALLCVLFSYNVKHISPITINNSVFYFSIFPSVSIRCFYTSNGCADWGGFENSKMDGVCTDDRREERKRERSPQ